MVNKRGNKGFMISVVIPTRNEAKAIRNMLAQFEEVIPSLFEVIVSDASSDQTAETARNYARTAPFPVRVVSSRPGRALQMNEGARHARGDILLFLHADTFLPEDGLMLIEKAGRWGGFCLQFENLGCGVVSSLLLGFISWRSNFRLRVFKIVYGDQALFVERKLFEEIGGFSEMPILEDLEISKRLRSRARMAYIQKAVTTSPRRFLKNGILSVYIKMFCVLLMYKLGIKPDKIKRFYEKQPSA